MKISFKIIALLAFFMLPTIAEAQFYTVYKTDGSSVLYNHTEIDSIVFSNETAPLIINGHEAVDLGLSVKWATCNVGASSPEEYGGYYAWGETEEKSDYDWDTYAYYNSSSYEYINIGSDIAGTSYDVAHVKWGGSWHMPTLTQIKELLNYCSWTCTTQNGVNGQLVTGPNGNSIFLPAAGYRYGASLHHAGSYGNYWSSTAGGDYSNDAYDLYFISGINYWSSNYRSYGFSVRPVSE